MGGVETILIGVAVAANVLILKWKLEKHRYEDAFLDGVILFGLAWVFQATYGGLVVATIASFIISLYFVASPPKFMSGMFDEIKQELKDHV